MSATDYATEALEAAGRARWEQILEQGHVRGSWDDLNPQMKQAVKQDILPHVWAALRVVPDGRHAAWALGYQVAYEAVADDVWEGPEHENPFPEPTDG